jgi:glycosyltransferase involved in cell wall biosynthesis
LRQRPPELQSVRGNDTSIRQMRATGSQHRAKQPLNICLLSEKYPPDVGGLAVSAHRLARGLADRGHTVHVCCISEAVPARRVEHVAQAGLKEHRVGASRRDDDTLADWFDTVVALHAAQPFDLLHGYYLVRAGYVCVYAARYLGVPSVVSARGNDLDRTIFDAARAGSMLWTLTHANAVTAVSCDLARRATALGASAPVTVIHNGVDATAFAPRTRDTGMAAQLGLAPDLPTIGFVGEARLKKGLATLLLAFEQLAGLHSLQLVLVGGVRATDAAVLDVFRRRQPDLPLHLVPPQPHSNLSRLYGLLDILVLPSLHDGLPNALLEGMACALPIVASAVGGIPDALSDGVNGRLVPGGDVTALAEALTSLLSDATERNRLGTAARRTVLDHFTIEQELAANLALYQRLLGTQAV